MGGVTGGGGGVPSQELEDLDLEIRHMQSNLKEFHQLIKQLQLKNSDICDRLDYLLQLQQITNNKDAAVANNITIEDNFIGQNFDDNQKNLTEV